MIELFAGLAPDLAAIEALMAKTLGSGEPRVRALIDSLGNFHGKMLRPSLVLMVASAVSGISPDHHRLGAALELIHTATLIHDDMIDEAATRRGQPTAHVAHGTSVAVLLGDYYYTHAFSLVAGMSPWLMERLTATTNVICGGELHQMLARRDLALSEAEYFRIIAAKTAVLCELAGELGAFQGTPAARAAAARYGHCCGMAFQIVDDCLDFSGDPQKIGKTLATDIERGLMTLPLIRTLGRAEPNQRHELGQRLLHVAGASDIDDIRRAVRDGGGIDSALTTAREHVSEAKRQLAVLPAGPARDQLAELADFIVARDF